MEGECPFVFIRKKGFTQGCIEEAGKMGNVSLVTYGQIYGYLNNEV